MKVAVFSTKKWVRDSFSEKVPSSLILTFFESALNENTVKLADGYDAVCVFVNDSVNSQVIGALSLMGVKTIALRCAGYNNVDLHAADEKGITVCRVPAYSPYAVAEHALGLILSLNRKYHRAHSRVRDGNFALDGLMGFDMRGKTIGVVGTGRIGQIFIETISGFGMKILAYDKVPSETLKSGSVEYVDLEELYRQSDIISLHCPLTQETYHLINSYALKSMKEGVMIINTSRGPLIETAAIIKGLKTGKIGYVGLDVYEEEEDLFFEDHSDKVIHDDTFVRLQTFPNVLITAHQAFFTREALANIRETTFKNLKNIEKTGSCVNLVTGDRV